MGLVNPSCFTSFQFEEQKKTTEQARDYFSDDVAKLQSQIQTLSAEKQYYNEQANKVKLFSV